METMDLFQMANVLSLEDRNEIISKLHEIDHIHPCCSACGSEVDIVFMRKLPGEDINQAMCLPCFLNNHTDVDQERIDRMVKIGEHNNYYYEPSDDAVCAHCSVQAANHDTGMCPDCEDDMQQSSLKKWKDKGWA